MIYLLHWYNPLLRLHLPTVLFSSNDRALTQFFDPLQRALFRNRLSILMLVLPRTTTLLKIWHKHLLRCQPSKSSKVVLHNGGRLLKAIGGIDPTDTNLIIFDLEDHIPRLPPQLAFQIQVIVYDKSICRTVIDEGASTCVMSVTCWKAIDSPSLTESHNTLKAFNGSGFKPYGVLPSLPIMLEGKTVQVEVEVFDAPLDYNLLLGRSWIDSMRAVVSTLFRVVRFPHQGKIVTVDQLAFFNSDTRTDNISFIAKTPLGYENVGVGLLKDSSLMGTFPIPPPDVPRSSVASINMISTSIHGTPTSHDPWMVPDPGDHLRYDDEMSLSPG
jgi:hypothetical protein